jgi:hypothetical protein
MPNPSTPARPALLRPELWKERIEALFDRPWLLVLTLALARALAFPYPGIIHDAQLYGLQVSRRLHPEPFERDLFFAFGSQDQYSLFSLLVAPIVSWFGLPIAFFLLYTVCSTLFIAGQVRLVSRLVADRWAGLLALMILAVGDLPYGGLQIFQVHEPFLTGRLPAVALAIWGIDQYLSRRWLGAGLCLAASFLIHPLMALPAWGLVGWWTLEELLPWNRLWTAGAGVVLSLGLLTAGVATGKLSLMSADWYETVYQISPQCFVSQWRMSDWIHLAFAVAGLLLAAVQGPTVHQRIARGVLLVGGVGLLLTAWAEIYPITLLLQAQPYRALWLVEFLAIPLGLTQASRLWREHTFFSRLLSVLFLFGLGRWRSPEGWDINLFWPYSGVLVLTFIVGREILFVRTSPHEPRRWTAGTWGLYVASLLVALLSIVVCVESWNEFMLVADPLTIVSSLLRATGNALVLLIAGVVLLTVMLVPRPRQMATVVCALSLVLLASGWARQEAYLPTSDADVAYVSSELKQLPAGGDSAGRTVYWPTDVRNVWFGLRSSSYYHFAQVQGAIFRDVTAREASRRLALVRPFEFRRLHYLGPFATRERLEPWLGVSGQGRPVLPTDLIRLAEDSALDVVVLPYRVGDLPARSNGSLWIYDCRDLRAARGTLAQESTISGTEELWEKESTSLPIR